VEKNAKYPPHNLLSKYNRLNIKKEPTTACSYIITPIDVTIPEAV